MMSSNWFRIRFRVRIRLSVCLVNVYAHVIKISRMNVGSCCILYIVLLTRCKTDFITLFDVFILLSVVIVTLSLWQLFLLHPTRCLALIHYQYILTHVSMQPTDRAFRSTSAIVNSAPKRANIWKEIILLEPSWRSTAWTGKCCLPLSDSTAYIFGLDAIGVLFTLLLEPFERTAVNMLIGIAKKRNV